MAKLSFALPQYDSAVIRLIGEIKAGLDKTDQLLGQIQIHTVVHRGIVRQVSEPKIVDTETQGFWEDVTFEFEMYRKTDVDEFATLMWGIWKSMASQAKKYMFGVLNRTTEAVGNSVAMQAGMNIWDAQIEMFKQMEMRFDQDGNHNVQIVMHPNSYKKLVENPPTPVQEQRLEGILKAKKEAYYAQKRARRLS